MYATTFPTGTVLPSGTMTLISCPSARATSSITALSVSTSARVSPVFTASPSCFVHLTRRPSSIVGDSASMWTLVAMGWLLEVEDAPRGGRDLLGRRLGGALEVFVVGHRDVSLGHALHGRVELVERVTLNDVHDLRADTGMRPAFLHDDGAIRLRDRRQDCRLIEGTQRPQVHHFGGHVLLGELLGGFQGYRDGLRVADQRHVGPLALHVRPPDRHEMLTLGDLALEVIEHLPLEDDDGVVVANGGLEEPFGVGGRRRG